MGNVTLFKEDAIKPNFFSWILVIVSLVGQLIIPSAALLKESDHSNFTQTAGTTKQEIAGSDPTAASLEWQYGTFGASIGVSGISLFDLDHDGHLEMILGGLTQESSYPSFWYVVRQTEPGIYEQVWISPKYASNITRIVVADSNHDQIGEVYVALSDGSIHIYDGSTFKETGHFSIGGFIITALIIADSNADGHDEILISDGTRIFIYSADTLANIWYSQNYGGKNLVVGNVDNDPQLEIVSSRGYILDGATYAPEGSLPLFSNDGINNNISLGDIDSDGRDEIVGTTSFYSLAAYNYDNTSAIWNLSFANDVDTVQLVDLDGDQTPEVLVGDGQWGSIHSYDGATGTEEWQIANIGNGVTNIAAGDINQDGVMELVWGTGAGISGAAQYLCVADTSTHSIVWKNDPIPPPFSAVDTGDVDDDGQTEIVMVSSKSQNWLGNGVIHIFDAATHKLEWRSDNLPGIYSSLGVNAVRIADVDDDGQTEFVITTNYGGKGGLFQVYNGKTHALKMQSAYYPNVYFTALETGDVDGDGQTEIIVGQQTSSEGFTPTLWVVFNGETGAAEWSSDDIGLPKGCTDNFKLADVDKDGRNELLAATCNGKVYVVDGVTHQIDWSASLSACALDTADLDGDGTLSILVGEAAGKVEIFNGATFDKEGDFTAGSGSVCGLVVGDVNWDGKKEWLVTESNRLSIYEPSGNLLWQSVDLGSKLAVYNQVNLENIDQDRQQEVVLGSNFSLYQFEIKLAPVLGPSSMKVSPSSPQPGSLLTYTITIQQNGLTDLPQVTLTNPLPGELIYQPDSLAVSQGEAHYTDGVITWAGPIGITDEVTLTYQANVKNNVPYGHDIDNSAVVSTPESSVTVTARASIPILKYYMPSCLNKDCRSFFDDFSNPASGWYTGEDTDIRVEYLQGEYRVLQKTAGYLDMFSSPACPSENYIVEVDARWEGITGSGYGLLFDLAPDYSQFYLLDVNTDYQEYTIFHYDSDGFSEVFPYNPNASIHRGVLSNHLKITRNGDLITLTINDYNIVLYLPATNSNGTGLQANSYEHVPNSDVRFDNFRVTRLTGDVGKRLSPSSLEKEPEGQPKMWLTLPAPLPSLPPASWKALTK